MERSKGDEFCPLSARTNARQRLRVARRKAVLLQSRGDYSKYKQVCDVVQRKCGLTESQVKKELGKAFKSCIIGLKLLYIMRADCDKSVKLLISFLT